MTIDKLNHANMKNIILLMFLATTAASAQYNKENLKLEPVAQQSKYRFQNLQLYPIRANRNFTDQHKKISKYATLKNALDQKKVAVTEAGDGTVNTLYIENVSADTVMILSGEVVKGGKQDRVIAQDFILYPKSGKKDISVFCVEHGRWQARSEEGEPRDKAREPKKNLEFKEYYSISPNEVRKAATVTKNQQEVWNKVSETTRKNAAGTSTGTLTALKQSADLNVELKKYLEHFSKVIVSEGDVIGVVAVTGDRILGSDMFATHRLLIDHYNNLVGSYATEAITSGATATLRYEKVQEYVSSILDDEARQEKEIDKNGTMLRDGKRKLHISTF